MTRDDQSLIRCVLGERAAADLERRYEHRRRLWLDGPYGGSVAFDKVMEREVGLYIAYNFTDIPAFLRHARVRGRLRHPHLLPVFDLGTTLDDLPYFTEPYVEARPLDLVLQSFRNEGPFPLLPIIRALIGVAEATAYAHKNGLCHLDLSPSHVQVGTSLEDVFLTGGWIEMNTPPPIAQEIAPTMSCNPWYAAPEQIHLSAGELTRREGSQAIDVYGLGGILHFILHGTPPNQPPPGAENTVLNVIQALLKAKDSPRHDGLHPGLQKPELSEDVEPLRQLCRQALLRDPRGRYPSVRDLARDLKDWLAKQNVSYQGPGKG